MLCTEKSLVKHDGGPIIVHPLRCKCWACSECGPIKHRDLQWKARRGEPTIFLTLTIRRGYRPTPDEQAQEFVIGFRRLRQWLERKLKRPKMQFIAIFEQHKSGWPHLHVLIRGNYIDQRIIVRWWKARYASHRIDIRRAKNPRQAASYVTKYVAKAPERFGTCRRWWCSQGWDLKKRDDGKPVLDERTWWERCDSRPFSIFLMAYEDGARCTWVGSKLIIENWAQEDRWRWGIG